MDDLRPTVFIVDDDPAVRESMSLLMASEGIPARSFPAAADFLERCPQGAPGCLVLDVRMPGMSGLELQMVLDAHGIDLPVIFLTAYADVPMAVEAVRAGAVDVLQKPVKAEQLLECIAKALRINAAAVSRREEEAEHHRRLERLTPREREVLALVVTGMTNKRIAAELQVSRRTVETHRANIMRKTGAGSLPELIRTAEADHGRGFGK